MSKGFSSFHFLRGARSIVIATALAGGALAGCGDDGATPITPRPDVSVPDDVSAPDASPADAGEPDSSAPPVDVQPDRVTPPEDVFVPPDVPAPPVDVPTPPPEDVPSPPVDVPPPPIDVPSPSVDVPSPPVDVPSPPVDVPSPPTQINVRVAHLSPDAPPVDFCVRNAGAASFTGPVLRSLSVGAGLAYTQVTRYLALDAGAYTVRLVAPGSTDCNAALGGLPDVTLPALAGRARATIGAVGLLAGSGATSFRLTAFVEDDTAAPTGQVRARFVHTSPGTPAVDVGIPGAGTAFTALFPNVAYPTASAYVNAPPLNAASIAARVAGTPTAAGAYPLQLDGVTAPAGTRLTVFAVGELDNDQTPLAALVCNDGAAPAGALTPCSLLPERAFVRVAHLSPDAPAVDICLRPASSSSWAVTPVLRGAGVASGLSFAQVTRYLALVPAQYQARLVAPGSTTCLVALGGLPDVTLPALAAGTRVTVAASGRLTGSGATAFALRPLADGNTRPALGRVHLRFAHLSPGAPNVDVGVVSGATFSPVFANVPYGSVANPAGSEPVTGYLPSAPLANATLQVRAAGTPTAVLTLPGVNVPATVSRGTSVTFFAIGLVGAAGNQRLSALACNDRTPATGLLAPCTRAP